MQDLEVNGSENLSPMMMMLQIQMLIVENYNDQVKETADKIKFLKDVISASHKNLNNLQTFLAQTSHEYHGKQIIDATASQMVTLMNSMVTYSYDTTNKTMTPKAIQFFDLEGRHKLDSNQNEWDGTTSSLDMSNYFQEIANLAKDDFKNSTSTARDKSQELGRQSNMQLPFFFNNNTYNNFNKAQKGTGKANEPIFSVYVDQVEKLMENIRTSISNIETEIDTLNTKLNDLNEKRKQALESANELIRKSNEAQTNTVNKM